MTVSDILLQNGSASLKDFYPLSKVKTEADKQELIVKGYNPGYTADEWPYDLPVERIYYSRQLFPSTYYYDPANAAIPIALNLNIHGTKRLPAIEDDAEFCKYILDFAASLKQPTHKKVFSYLLAQDDGIRSDLLAEYIRRSEPTPELFDLFMSYYTTTDYGAGRYDADLLQKLFSGRSEEQIQAVSESLSDQPEIFHVYRGEAEGSTPYHKAFSWSLNINTAFFFACRHGDRNHCRIIRAKVRKKDVMATKLDSKEMEVIILPGRVFDVSKEKLLGPDSPAVMPPKYLDEYADGRDRIKALYKRYSKSDKGEHDHNNAHDMLHSARVLFLALEIIQAGKIKLNTKELEQLTTAIVYHDIGRSNDCVDYNHGKESRGIYEKRGQDPVVSFLIEHHCLGDRDSEVVLQDSNIKAKKRAWLLYQILKDADALDRVRFGIYGLDVNFLRLPISHKLVPLAVSAVHGVEI